MKQGEVWKIDLDPTGSAGKKARLSCVVVNNDHVGLLPLKIVVPLVEWKDKFAAAAWQIPIHASPDNGLRSKSSADTMRIRSLTDDHFIEKLGRISDRNLVRIKAGISIVLDLQS